MGVRNSEGYMDLVPYKAMANIDREKKAAAFAEYAYQNGCIPVTPHLLFPFMNDEDEAERALAIHMDIVLMGKCKEVWVLSERITAGMSTEIEKAKRRRQAVRYFANDFTEVER